jgi:hypothetical protein
MRSVIRQVALTITLFVVAATAESAEMRISKGF